MSTRRDSYEIDVLGERSICGGVSQGEPDASDTEIRHNVPRLGTLYNNSESVDTLTSKILN